MLKSLIIVISALGAILLFLLASAGTNDTLFAQNYAKLLIANGVLAAALVVLVALQLRTLWREYRLRQFGSRLKLKLIAMFVLLAVVPGSIIYVVSVQFAVRSIESSYNVRVDTALQSGLSLGRSALDALVEQLAERVHTEALDLSDMQGLPSLPTLSSVRERLGADTANILSSNGQVLVSSSRNDALTLIPEKPSANWLGRAKSGEGPAHWVESDQATGRLVMRVLQPISNRDFSLERPLLQVTLAVPENLARSAESIQNLHRDYQELLLARQGLKQMYLITLTLALLLGMFAAIAVAFIFAKNLSAPLLILAEGTQAVASGDFTPRQALPARDELGVLTQSFNRMTRQLLDARALADSRSAQVDAARAYLESVLINLSTGVLTFSEEGFLRAANRGAITSLGDDLSGCESVPLAQWSRNTQFRDAVLTGFRENENTWHRQLEIDHSEGYLQTLLLHGSRLLESPERGFVVVFDDISALISAQRNAAWTEVARRLAHEIKNPLTPIQLAAERLEHRLSDHLDEKDRAMLSRSIQTIVNQVEAMKNLVNSFRDYAKLTPASLCALDLNTLLYEVLVLYEGAKANIVVQLEPDLPLVLADASQLRQVIHNLLQNAQDAVAELDDGRIILSTHHEGQRVSLQISDNGAGFSAAILSRAFEPYATTKVRGSGLGLAIVKKIVDEHLADIALSNLPEGGAMVRIRLQTAQQHLNLTETSE